MRKHQGSKIVQKIVLPTIAVAFIAIALTVAPLTKNAFAQQVTVTVTAVDTNGNVLDPGYYVQLVNSTSGEKIADGFTPKTFNVTSSGEAVDVQSYTLVFDHWKEDGGTNAFHLVCATQSTTLTAVMRDPSQQASPTKENGPACPDQQQGSNPGPQLQTRSNVELNRLVAKMMAMKNAEVVNVASGSKPEPLSAKNIPSATGSLYELVNDDPIGVANVMTAVQVGGIDWNSLSEGQKLYMYEVLQYGQPASTNTASISDIPSTNLSGVPLGATGSKITYKSFYDIVSADPVGAATAIDEIQSGGIDWNSLSDAQKSYLVLTYEYGLPANQPTVKAS
jgi:hypothetical protein